MHHRTAESVERHRKHENPRENTVPPAIAHFDRIPGVLFRVTLYSRISRRFPARSRRSKLQISIVPRNTMIKQPVVCAIRRECSVETFSRSTLVHIHDGWLSTRSIANRHHEPIWRLIPDVKTSATRCSTLKTNEVELQANGNWTWRYKVRRARIKQGNALNERGEFIIRKICFPDRLMYV